MRPLRMQAGAGYSPTATAEEYIKVQTVRGGPVLVYCHGSGDTAHTAWNKTGQSALIRALAQDYTVIAPDLGFQAFGNDTHVTRIEQAVTFMGAETVTLVAGSMGCLGALNYARQHPEKVEAVAAIIPALDLQDLMSRGAGTDINTAYGGTYNDEVQGPTHSPVQYASTLSVPIHLFTSSNDTITVPATAAAFMAKSKTAARTNIGTGGHSEASVSASITPVVKWLKMVRNRNS